MSNEAVVTVHADTDEQVQIFVLEIVCAGPNYREMIEITAENMLELEPAYIDRDGYSFERYGEDDDYIEVRRDLVVKRSLHALQEIDTEDMVGAELPPEDERGDHERHGA